MSNSSHVVSYLLFISVALLAAVIPGGLLGTRNFSQMSLAAIVAYNMILVGLGVFSILSIVFVIKVRRWAYISAILCGASYIAVYSADFWGLYPITPDPMPLMLFATEVVGIFAAMLLILFSTKAASRPYPLDGEVFVYEPPLERNQLFLAVVIIAAIAVVAFASFSAARP